MRHLLPLLISRLILQTGCALLPHRKIPTPPQPAHHGEPDIRQSIPSPSPKKRSILPHFSLIPPFFHHPPPPPRAQGLVKVGTIRTISPDGSYVIAKMEPGTVVSTGRDLIVTAAAGEPVQLKVAENQPPYFIADVKSGHPSVGQFIFQ